MFAAISRYKVDERSDEVVQRGHEEFVPIARNIPGFVAHYAMNLSDDEALLVGIFEDQAGIEQFLQASLEWLQKRVFPMGAPYNQPPLQTAVTRLKAFNTPEEARLFVECAVLAR
ncbi:MAG: hypothetical protein OHK0022_20460 [Roseiflexaceae bacterium]